MADNTVLNTGTGGDTIATDDLLGVKHQRVKVEFGADGSATDVSSANPLPVVQTGTPALPTGASTAAKQPALGTAGAASADVISVQGVASMTPLKVDGSGVTQPVSGPLTDAQLRATAVPVSGTVTASGPLTDVQLRATAVPVSGPLTDTQLRATAVPVSGPLTDTQLRATAVPVSGTVTASGPLTDAQLRATAVPVSGPLTDAQLRATAVPVSGTVTASGPLTDAQLRATAVPVSGTVTAQLAATTTGGLSKFHLVSAATTNATNVKASAGKLHGWYIYNSNAAARKVAFHNNAGTPTAGTGVTDSLVIPPASAANAFSETGITFATGIAITTVTDLTDAGTTAVGLNDLVINLYYA